MVQELNFINMINTLTKNYTFETVIPNSYQEWIPGYSYFKESSEAKLTASGRTYIAANINTLGYKIPPFPYS